MLNVGWQPAEPESLSSPGQLHALDQVVADELGARVHYNVRAAPTLAGKLYFTQEAATNARGVLVRTIEFEDERVDPKLRPGQPVRSTGDL